MNLLLVKQKRQSNMINVNYACNIAPVNPPLQQWIYRVGNI